MKKPWFKSYDKNVPCTLNYPDATLADFLIDTAAKYPHYIATTLNEVDLTYREINEKANGFAHALGELGVKKGNRIALVIPNSPTYVIAFYAIMKIGAVAVNINVMSHGDELVKFLNDAEAKIAITLDLFAKNIADTVGKTGLATIIVHSVFGLEKEIHPGENAALLIFNQLVEAQSKQEPELACTPDDIAVLQYTSGSTGIPKAPY